MRPAALCLENTVFYLQNILGKCGMNYCWLTQVSYPIFFSFPVVSNYLSFEMF